MRGRAIAVTVALAWVRSAVAAPDDDFASATFHAAEVRAAANDPGALDALEAIGAARPVTRWSDDAYTEAARTAERAGDLARARRDLEQALAITTDEALARRARMDLVRLARTTGETGEFAGVAATHDRLVTQLQQGGDPKPALRELATLVEANPRYPRAATAMLALASGWERDGEFAIAHTWLVRARGAATPGERERVLAEVVRFAIHAGELAEAKVAITAIEDRGLAAELTSRLETARSRRTLQIAAGLVLALVAAAFIVRLRRTSGSWRSAARRLGRPPIEVVFLAPIALVITVVAMTGNPLVAHAVRAIALVGVAVAWFSGVVLAGERPSARRAIVHGLLAALVVLGACYLAIDRDRMIDLVVETWRSGPQGR